MKRNHWQLFWREFDIATPRDLITPIGITVGIVLLFCWPGWFWRGIVWVVQATQGAAR